MREEEENELNIGSGGGNRSKSQELTLEEQSILYSKDDATSDGSRNFF